MNTITLTLEATPKNLRAIAAMLDGSHPVTEGKADEAPRTVVADEVPRAAIEEAPAEESAEEPAKEVITKEVIRAKAVALTKEGKQAELKKVLEHFGAAKLSGLKEKDYEEAFAMMQEV